MSMVALQDDSLARTLILDEIFDLALYRALHERTTGPLRTLLGDLIRIEETHVRFWQDFFHSPITALDVRRRIKLYAVLGICRLFGAPVIHVVLEAIEVYGVRKYLSIWRLYQNQPLGSAVKDILIDEFKHEDVIVSQLTERKINPQRIRNIFLGLNDGLVEILGAVSGFFGAFQSATLVLVAGATTAVAGSLSMAAGAYVAMSSEQEITATEQNKKQFLKSISLSDRVPLQDESLDRPLQSAALVGVSYFAGAMVPLLPVLFGAKNAVFSLIVAGSVIIVVSMVLAFLSGMDMKRRMVTNVVIITAAVGVTYVIGRIVKEFFGVSV